MTGGFKAHPNLTKLNGNISEKNKIDLSRLSNSAVGWDANQIECIFIVVQFPFPVNYLNRRQRF